MIAHVGGVPVEETLLPLASCMVGAGLLLARTWLVSPVRRGRSRSAGSRDQEFDESMDRPEEIVDNPDGGAAEHVREYVAPMADGATGSAAARRAPFCS